MEHTENKTIIHDTEKTASCPYLTENAPSLCSPILCTEIEDNQRVRLLANGEIKAGEPLFAVETVEE